MVCSLDYFGDLTGELYFGCNVIQESTDRYIYIFFLPLRLTEI